MLQIGDNGFILYREVHIPVESDLTQYLTIFSD